MLLLSAILLAVTAAPATAAPPQRYEFTQPGMSLEWPALLERNRRVTFTQRADGDALVELDRDDIEDAERAIALFALGTARRDDSRSLLVQSYRKGAPLVQYAAILALGEARLVEGRMLDEWLENPDSMIRECGLLAGLIGGEPTARTRLQNILAEDGHLLGSVAPELSTFVLDIDRAVETSSTRLYLELRYAAGKGSSRPKTRSG